jgi:hypothetical protein
MKWQDSDEATFISKKQIKHAVLRTEIFVTAGIITL